MGYYIHVHVVQSLSH